MSGGAEGRKIIVCMEVISYLYSIFTLFESKTHEPLTVGI